MKMIPMQELDYQNQSKTQPCWIDADSLQSIHEYGHQVVDGANVMTSQLYVGVNVAVHVVGTPDEVMAEIERKRKNAK